MNLIGYNIFAWLFAKSKAKLQFLSLHGVEYNIKTKYFLLFSRFFVTLSIIDDLDMNKSYVISKDGKAGPYSTKLYNKLRAIQYGDESDKYGWITIVE